MMKKAIVAMATMVAAVVASADTTPVMVSLVTPLQVPTRRYDVAGLRLDVLYGECHDFTGLDLGLVNHSKGDFTGLAIGAANLANGYVYGGQIGLLNINGNGKQTWGKCSKGFQVGIFNSADTFCGLQDGVVNFCAETMTGAQGSFVNIANDINGAQIGYYVIIGINFATGKVRGCQIGLLNVAEEMENGCQIGLVNIIGKGGVLPISPIFNCGF